MANRTTKSKSAKNARRDSEQRGDTAESRSKDFRVAAGRETVEAFVVAFILALLFRAFLAEAFVIPTGSMAPTLMGAHKDLVCDECGTSFQCGASRERSEPVTNLVVVAGVCPNCRHVNALDLQNEGNDSTFNGDRIVVSKYSYAIGDPERWDVIVFKYPGNPKQNYIKRLVGLPNETLTIRHGDVYVRPTGSERRPDIVRKPAEKLLAMRHLVYDADRQSQSLIDANYPSRWQPWLQGELTPPSDSWQIERSSDGLTATVDGSASDKANWLRYYHRWPTDSEWKVARNSGSLADVNPQSSRLITDFYAYDAYGYVPAQLLYTEAPTTRSSSSSSRWSRMLNGGYSRGVFHPSYKSGGDVEQFGGNIFWGGQDRGGSGIGKEGMHWVGDLIVEATIETSDDAQELTLELVEAGIKYQCNIDLSSGKATLGIDDIEERQFDQADGMEPGLPTAQTSVVAGTRNRVRFSNCDDQLLLWIDGGLVEFDRPTTFDARQFRSMATNYPQFFPEHPLDAAPIAIAVRGGKATVRSLRIDRDKYYVATENSNYDGIIDYDMSKFRGTPSQIQSVFKMPNRWAEFTGWEARREVTFELQQDQFFPMGDNSPESLDARCWAGSRPRKRMPRDVNRDAWRWKDESYVPRELMVGKALVVFWPHSWNSPVPFSPNFKRFKLIR